MRIKKVRNFYQLESVDTYKMETMDEEEKKKYLQQDVDNMYSEEGVNNS